MKLLQTPAGKALHAATIDGEQAICTPAGTMHNRGDGWRATSTYRNVKGDAPTCKRCIKRLAMILTEAFQLAEIERQRRGDVAKCEHWPHGAPYGGCREEHAPAAVDTPAPVEENDAPAAPLDALYCRTFSATRRHIVRAPGGRGGRTLCGHEVSLTTETTDRTPGHEWMIRLLEPCGKCEKSQAKYERENAPAPAVASDDLPEVAEFPYPPEQCPGFRTEALAGYGGRRCLDCGVREPNGVDEHPTERLDRLARRLPVRALRLLDAIRLRPEPRSINDRRLPVQGESHHGALADLRESGLAYRSTHYVHFLTEELGVAFVERRRERANDPAVQEAAARTMGQATVERHHTGGYGIHHRALGWVGRTDLTLHVAEHTLDTVCEEMRRKYSGQ